MEKTFDFAQLSTFPELAEQTNLLVEEAFGYRNNHRFSADFAPLAGPHNFQNRHILLDPSTKHVVAHIGCLPRLFCWGGEVIPVVLIGGIAVDESTRGQGHFKEMFLRVLALYHSQCAFFLLWSDKHELYAKYDFILAGRQWCYRSVGAQRGEATTLTQLSETDFKQVKQLYRSCVNQHSFSPLRDDEDWEHVKAVTSSHLYLLRQDQQVTGYYFRDKGMDLEGIVHDWAHRDGVLGLLRDAGNPGVIWAAENAPVADEVMQDLQQVGLWRANSHPMALKKISGLLDGASVECQDTTFIVKNGRGTFRLSPNDLIEEIFGHGKHGLRSQILPVWVGGLDSV